MRILEIMLDELSRSLTLHIKGLHPYILNHIIPILDLLHVNLERIIIYNFSIKYAALVTF